MNKVIHRQIPVREKDWNERAVKLSENNLYNLSRAMILTMAIKKGLDVMEREINGTD